jgi:hypothetical protein
MRTQQCIAALVSTGCVMLCGGTAIAERFPLPAFSLSYGSVQQANAPTSQPAGSEDEDRRPAAEDSSSGDLAKKLQNPVADLISVPFQSNFDSGGGIDLPSGRSSRFLQRVLPPGPARFASRIASFALRDEPDRD